MFPHICGSYGLNCLLRGAHTFFLRQREVPRWSGHLVNLIHYEDAACLCLKVNSAEDFSSCTLSLVHDSRCQV